MKIKDWPKPERPREKMIRYGPEKLTNSELLAVLLGTGPKGTNVVELSKRILARFGGERLPKVGYGDLKDFFGLGPAKSCQILACFELGKRLLKNKKAELYLTPCDVHQELRDLCGHKKEHFVVLYLDTRNQEIRREVVSIGSLNASLVHPREVFEPAVRNSAAQVIVAHNHPSGDPDPSEQDKEVTRRLVQAGKVLGIELLDHVIVTRDGFFSFREKNLLG